MRFSQQLEGILTGPTSMGWLTGINTPIESTYNPRRLRLEVTYTDDEQDRRFNLNTRWKALLDDEMFEWGISYTAKWQIDEDEWEVTVEIYDNQGNPVTGAPAYRLIGSNAVRWSSNNHSGTSLIGTALRTTREYAIYTMAQGDDDRRNIVREFQWLLPSASAELFQMSDPIIYNMGTMLKTFWEKLSEYAADEGIENGFVWCSEEGTERVCWHCIAGRTHSVCERCGRTASDTHDAGDYGQVCNDCLNNSLFICEHCNSIYSIDDVYTYEVSDETWCENCYSSGEAVSCADCGIAITWHAARNDLVPGWGQDEYGDWFCPRHFDGNNAVVRSWDYEPEFILHGKLKNEIDTGPFFGMEIETSWGNGRYAGGVIEKWWEECKVDEDIMYVKTDSSVENGYEIVTHPMKFEWAMENFPWDTMDALVNKYGAKETHSSCGGHVHINKDAFKDSHFWKFLQFHYRLPEFCEMIGGRKSARWGGFTGDFSASRQHAKRVAKEKVSNGTRYMALNLQNPDTVEMRYPAGGSSAHLMKKNLQLAHSIYTFTKVVDVALFRDGIMDDPGYFLWWVKDQDTYPDLVKYIEKSIPTPKQFKKESN